MGKTNGWMHVGTLVGALAAVGGCGGNIEGSDPSDVVGTTSALESSYVDNGLSGGSTVNIGATLGDAPALLEPALNLSGIAATTHTSGVIDRTNPFFQNLGTNGRTCESCHDARAAWTDSSLLSTLLFELTQAAHPMFVSQHDTGNRPDAPYGTLAEKRAALSTLLQHGLTRFQTANHVGNDYDVTAIDDPYGWGTPALFQRFRRAGTNLGFTNRIPSSTTTGTPNPTVRTQLQGAMNGGTLFHAQGTVPLTVEQQSAGADFMLGLSFAQIYDFIAGRLDSGGARGGSANLSAEPFPVEGGFDLYTAWADACNDGPGTKSWCSLRNRKREQIARGQEVFNTLQFQVSGVAGLNDTPDVPVTMTCSGCHNAKNVGSSTTVRFMDIGVTAEASRPSWLPLITVKNRTTNEIKKVTDLGRATSTRNWADIGKVRVLGLRGLASRAPYFHAGQANTVGQAVSFHQTRFNIPLTAANRADLEAFLLAL